MSVTDSLKLSGPECRGCPKHQEAIDGWLVTLALSVLAHATLDAMNGFVKFSPWHGLASFKKFVNLQACDHYEVKGEDNFCHRWVVKLLGYRWLP